MPAPTNPVSAILTSKQQQAAGVELHSYIYHRRIGSHRHTSYRRMQYYGLSLTRGRRHCFGTDCLHIRLYQSRSSLHRYQLDNYTNNPLEPLFAGTCPGCGMALMHTRQYLGNLCHFLDSQCYTHTRTCSSQRCTLHACRNCSKLRLNRGQFATRMYFQTNRDHTCTQMS